MEMSNLERRLLQTAVLNAIKPEADQWFHCYDTLLKSDKYAVLSQAPAEHGLTGEEISARYREMLDETNWQTAGLILDAILPTFTAVLYEDEYNPDHVCETCGFILEQHVANPGSAVLACPEGGGEFNPE